MIVFNNNIKLHWSNNNNNNNSKLHWNTYKKFVLEVSIENSIILLCLILNRSFCD